MRVIRQDLHGLASAVLAHPLGWRDSPARPHPNLDVVAFTCLARDTIQHGVRGGT